MFILRKYEGSELRVPAKVWLYEDDFYDIEESARQQIANLCNLPFTHSHVAIMPDVHSGYGMPIGGVLATEGVIIPNAVGVDIGCGMCFIDTNLPASILNEVTTPSGPLASAIVGNIMRSIPTGFNHHKRPQKADFLDTWEVTSEDPKELRTEVDRVAYQLGTLGGGNHFIELQSDEEGRLGIMLHSGSRNFGYKVCNYYNKLAKRLNESMGNPIPKAYDLAFLPVDSREGQEYIKWMNFALTFARENRQLMMERVVDILVSMVEKHANIHDIRLSPQINAHHNYAELEEHSGKSVWVHRKGAIRAREGEEGIIPGAMGSYSYIVMGQGNDQSFHSASHGAGRVYSRTAAKKEFSAREVLEDLKNLGVTLGKAKKADVADEARFAYKDIDQVMAAQGDLVHPVKRLKTVVVIKG
jgi:tRNA-splicing ligase RtcB